ncbi:MAG: DUF1566 domain-containing protein [Turneriella sp.]|nr:DUF1566 domain-containing protein [Turneriella sp.]
MRATIAGFLVSLFFCGCGSLLRDLEKTRTLAEDGVLTFTPPAGAYYSQQNVAIASTTSGQICYTLDGSNPGCSAGKCSSGSAYSTGLVMPGTAGQSRTVTVRATLCRLGVESPAITTALYTIDMTPPVLLSSLPANAATNVYPCASTAFGAGCTGTISLVFSKRMHTALAQTLALDVWNGAAFVTATVSGKFTFSQTNIPNDTITVRTSWFRFPEVSQIRYTIPVASLQDESGNAIASQVQRTFTTTVAPVKYAVPDTGVTSCYNASSMQTCPIAGFLNQDADYVNTPNARNFSGPTLHATFSSDYTTTDNTTGLVWKTCNDGQSGGSCATGVASSVDWYTALNQCDALNNANTAAGYAGRRNWRLPTIAELESLPQYDLSNPAINITNFPNPGVNSYWSASTYSTNALNAWQVQFGSGITNNTAKTSSASVRCVSHGSTLNAATLQDNANGTVTDLATNLVWTKCSMDNTNTGTLQTGGSSCANLPTGTRTWGEALTDCKNLTLGGRTWRLPNLNEIKSLVYKGANSPAIQTAAFPGTASLGYWSSTTNAANAANAWAGDFSNGGMILASKTGVPYSVRCVATGP